MDNSCPIKCHVGVSCLCCEMWIYFILSCRSCSGRDRFGPFRLSDSSWVTPHPENPLAVGQYVNNCSNGELLNNDNNNDFYLNHTVSISRPLYKSLSRKTRNSAWWIVVDKNIKQSKLHHHRVQEEEKPNTAESRVRRRGITLRGKIHFWLGLWKKQVWKLCGREFHNLAVKHWKIFHTLRC